MRILGPSIVLVAALLASCARSEAQTTGPSVDVSVLPPPGAFRTVMAIQTLLDRKNFSCGCLDGVGGDRTLGALQTWQASRGLVVTNALGPDAVFQLGIASEGEAFTTHTVTTGEIASLSPVPATWLEKSRVPSLAFETILEYVAEKYHAKEEAIVRLNPGADWPNPSEGTVLVVPHPRPFSYPQASSITIELGAKRVLVYDEKGRVLALFPCSIAKKAEKRPVGDLKIVNCAENPEYTFDPKLFEEDEDARTVTKRLLLPPGPNNPVGDAWIGLDLPGYGLHGTPHPEDVGKTESHGCFRLTNWNARKLARMIKIGMPVRVEQ